MEVLIVADETYRIQSTEYRIQDTGYTYRIRNTGYRMETGGYMIFPHLIRFTQLHLVFWIHLTIDELKL